MNKEIKKWKRADLADIRPRKDTWPASILSIGYQMGITGFGVNGKTVNKGESLTPPHTETESNQEELFIIVEGAAEFSLDDEKCTVNKGALLYVAPEVVRSAVALKDNTTMLILGGEPGKPYRPGWIS